MPFEQIPEEIKRVLMNGTTDEDEDKYGIRFEGVIPNLMRTMEKHRQRIRQGQAARFSFGAALPELQRHEAAAGGRRGNCRR